MIYGTTGVLTGSITTSKLANLAVTTVKIAANAITGDKLTVTLESSGSQSIGAGTSWTPSARWMQWSRGNSIVGCELYVLAAWRACYEFDGTPLMYDGANQRITNTSGGAYIIYWQKL